MENSTSGKSPLYRLGLVGAFVGMFVAPTVVLYQLVQRARLGSEQETATPATAECAQLTFRQATIPARKKPSQKTERQTYAAIMPVNATTPVDCPRGKRFPSRPLASQTGLAAKKAGQRGVVRNGI